MAEVDGFEGGLAALRERAGELAGMGISARATACLTDTVWRRWTRLSSAVRSRERALESTALEWRSFEEKVRTFTFTFSHLADAFVQKRSTREREQSS